ncbi:MAG: sulfonate transport system substrate-binding protein [Solirubrobacteraceae bacterium]|jgi:sulfonate transport system substrate-binding protein|nr:sulfonate transport system substrate-binding protein [Solirubrobacteraceae bacterium]
MAACGSSGGASTQAPTVTGLSNTADVSHVTLRIGDQAGTGAQALLKAAGLLDKLPFKATWSDFTSGPPMLQALSAGALDLGGVGNAPPVFAAAGGAKIAVVGAFANNPNSGALLVPKGSPITSLSQLKGKKIAVAQGSSADYHLISVLRKAGLGVHDVSLVYLQPAAGLSALNSGNVDAWDVWSPFIEEASILHGAHVLVNENGVGGNNSYVVAAASALGDSAKANAIRDYLRLLDQAHVWADRHPGAWAAQWAQATGLPMSVMVPAAKDNTSKPVAVDATITAAEQGVVDTFSSAGLIPTRYSFGKFVTSAFNSAVVGGS